MSKLCDFLLLKIQRVLTTNGFDIGINCTTVFPFSIKISINQNKPKREPFGSVKEEKQKSIRFDEIISDFKICLIMGEENH